MICARCYLVLTHPSYTSQVLGASLHERCYELEWSLRRERFVLDEKYNLPREHDVDYVDMEGPPKDIEGWAEK